MSYAPRNETDYQRSSNSGHDNTKNEKPGPVTSDSLAAESISSGGSFASGTESDSRGPTAHSNAASNSTLASATRLDPAPDAEARSANEEWTEASQLNAGRSLGYQDSGRGPTYNPGPKSTDGIDPPKPAGKNLTEGGFYSGEEANASYGTDIGGKRDPGRVALGEMVERNEAAAGGAGPKQRAITGDGQFEALGGDADA